MSEPTIKTFKQWIEDILKPGLADPVVDKERDVVCTRCDGTGRDDHNVPCNRCKGTGYTKIHAVRCKNCDSTGIVQPKKLGENEEECKKCNGTGFTNYPELENVYKIRVKKDIIKWMRRN